MEDQGLLTISILGTPHYFTQGKEETVAEFRIRVQKYFDDNNINIQITC